MIEKHKKGLISKLNIMQDYASKGYHVYNEMNNSGPVDFVAIHPDKVDVVLVESKTDSFRKKGTRVHRVLSPAQKKLGVKMVYYDTETKRVFSTEK